MKLSKCVNKSSDPVICQPLNVIDNAILGQASALFVNRYFSSLNFEDPITPFIDDFYWDIVPDLKKKSDIFVSKAEARL